MHVTPGDPALIMLGAGARAEDLQALRHNLGLDQPIYVQYGRFLSNILRGDLGESIVSKRPVLSALLQRLPVTLVLTISSLIIAVLLALPLGTLSAIRRASILDYGSMSFALLGVSAPVFWVGVIFIFIFSFKLSWFPGSGYASISGDGFAAFIRHLILPGFALGLGMAALLARITRSTLLDVLGEDYVRTARAKGLREGLVVMRHGLRNALLPLVTVLGLQFAALMGGAVVTETVFALPGVGRFAVYGMQSHDFPVVQGVVLVVAVVVVAVNVLVDISYVALDPRVKYN